jgi:hypothetical protein
MEKQLSRSTFLFFVFVGFAVIAVLSVSLAAASPAAASRMAHASVAANNTCGSLSAGGGVWAQSDPFKSWEFERFDSDIEVHEDGSFTVRETQVVNFTGSFSFLTRDIPTRMAGFEEGRT